LGRLGRGAGQHRGWASESCTLDRISVGSARWGSWPGVKQSWRQSKRSVACDSGRDAGLAWSEESQEIHLVVWGGANWTELGTTTPGAGGVGATPSRSQTPTLDVDPSGKPVVAWQEYFPDAVATYLRRWNGTLWEQLGDSATGNGVSTGVSTGQSYSTQGPQVRLDPQGTPFVVWQAFASPAFAVFLRYWNGAAWVGLGGSDTGGGVSNTGSGPGQSPSGESPALAVDSQGQPVVVWENLASAREIYLKRWSGTAWEELGGSASGGGISAQTVEARVPTVAIDSLDRPLVAWEQSSTLYLRRWNGAQWEELGGSGSVGLGLSNHRTRPCVASGAAASLVIAFWSGSCIFVKRWTGTQWEELAGSATGTGISGSLEAVGPPSLVLDSQGNPLVAWSSEATGNSEIYVVRWNGSAWVPHGADSNGSGGDQQYAGELGQPLLGPSRERCVRRLAGLGPRSQRYLCPPGAGAIGRRPEIVLPAPPKMVVLGGPSSKGFGCVLWCLALRRS
jgi:hypothetical protein